MNFGLMIEDATRRLEEAVGSPIHWTSDQIADAVNDGLEELSDATEFYERSLTLSLKPLTHYYDTRSIAYPYLMLRVTSIWNPVRNQWLDPITVPDLDYRTARQWELVVGDARFWFMRGLWWLGLFPTDTAEDKVLQVHYKALHPRMVYSEEEPQQLPANVHDAMIHYAVYDLLSKDGETQKALAYWGRYLEAETEIASRTGSRIVRDRVGRMGVY